MFGIEDPGIWIVYMMMVACVIFAIGFSIVSRKRKDEQDDNNV